MLDFRLWWFIADGFPDRNHMEIKTVPIRIFRIHFLVMQVL